MILSADNFSNKIQIENARMESQVESLASFVSQNFDYEKATQNEDYVSSKAKELDPLVKNTLIRYHEEDPAIVSSYIVFNSDNFPVSQNVHQSWYLIDENKSLTMGPSESKDIYQQEDDPDMQWYFQPKKTGQGSWTEVYSDVSTGVPMISYVEPIYSEDNKFIGVVGIDISEDKKFIGVAGMDMSLEELSSELSSKELSVKGSFFLLDSYSNYIAQPKENISSEMFSRMTEEFKKENSGLFIDDPYVISYVKLPNKQVLGYISTVKETLRTARVFEIWAGLAILLIAISSILVSYFFISKTILEPLIQLKQATEKISRGHLDVPIEIKSKDELGELATSFNEMVASLKESKSDIEKKINKRTKGLKKLNQYMVGRELKMIELKKEISELKDKKDS